MPPREGDLRTLPSQENLAQDEYLENTFISRVQSNTDLPASMSANNSHTSLSSLHSMKSLSSLHSVKSLASLTSRIDLVSLEELQEKEPLIEKEFDTYSDDNKEEKDHFFLFWN